MDKTPGVTIRGESATVECADLGRICADLGPKCADLGRICADLGRICADLGPKCADLAGLAAGPLVQTRAVLSVLYHSSFPAAHSVGVGWRAGEPVRRASDRLPS